MVVAGEIEKKMVYSEHRGGDGGGGIGGAKSYKIFAPSHPQAVNQYVREYSYNPRQHEQPTYDYSQTLQQYNDAVARKYRVIIIITRKSCTGRSPVRSIGLRA